jgi:hypothetical protein
MTGGEKQKRVVDLDDFMIFALIIANVFTNRLCLNNLIEYERLFSMTYKNGEYTVVVSGDDSQYILRESTLPTGLLMVEELARLDYSDEKEHAFPVGLIKPTPEEVVRFGGLSSESSSKEALDVADYGPVVNIKEIKQKISSFLIDAITDGRNPVLAWTEEASEEEVEAFQEAVKQVQESYNPAELNATERQESFGLYL